MLPEPLIASRISRSRVGIGMPSAVELDDEAACGASQVDDPGPYLMLPPKAEATDATPKCRPQKALFVRLPAPKLPGILDVPAMAAHSRGLVQQVCPVGPSPRPSPRLRREREA